MSEQQPSERRLIRKTRGICHTCLQSVPAEVVSDGRQARLEKICPEHGVSQQLLSRHPGYWRELDEYYFKVNAQEYPQRDFLLRLTEACNLDCPICLAKANTEQTDDLDLSGLERLLESQGRRIKVDFMAAEPTLRKDLEHWVRKVKALGHIAALHSNGLKLANLDYAQRMKDCGFDEVFLQFDGFDPAANRWLRGRDGLLELRLKALENLRQVGLAANITVVVAHGLNEPQVGESLRFALQPENDHIREVFFLGLRILGSLRDGLRQEGRSYEEMAVMPDETLDMASEQEPALRRDDIRIFNKLYFALLSVFKVKKCLYIQHYLILRDGKGGFVPFSDLADMQALDRAAERYARQLPRHPRLARARFLASLARHSMNPRMLPVFMDFMRLQLLLRTGMKLDEVSRRVVMLGFITACDPHNFDEQVAINCGKGELSTDGGFVDSGAQANVRREQRFDESDRRPGSRAKAR